MITHMKSMLKVLVSILAGFFLAILILIPIFIYKFDNLKVFNPNGWGTLKEIGSPDADILTRALIAKVGIFANSPDQAIYMSAYVGEPIPSYMALLGKPTQKLLGGHHYRISGNVNLPVTWWSITLYNDQDFLFKNKERVYSFNSENLETDAEGNFVLDVAAEKPNGATNWLPAPKNEEFTVIIRFYEPQPELYEHLENYDLPKVEEIKN